jgi:hypothetical protein
MLAVETTLVKTRGRTITRVLGPVGVNLLFPKSQRAPKVMSIVRPTVDPLSIGGMRVNRELPKVPNKHRLRRTRTLTLPSQSTHARQTTMASLMKYCH